MNDVRELLQAAPPAAVDLARVLSLAVSVEPELLRRARLTLTRLDASAEADLWWSELVSARNPRGLTFHTEVSEELRRELAEDADLFERAWAVVEQVHEGSSWAIRLEEKLRYISLLPALRRRERSQQLLAAAGREMTEGTDGKDAARWLARAVPQMPASVREGGEARVLEAGAAMRLTGWLDLAWMDELPEGATGDWLPWVMPDDLPRISVPVRLLEGAVEIGEAAWEGGEVLDLPGTDPLALEVVWHRGTEAVRRWVTWEEGETRRVPIGSDWVELATLTGERFRLRDAERTQAVGSTGSGTDELDFGPLKAKHRPFLDREEVMVKLERWVEEGKSVQVLGETGSGKTAILSALADRLKAQAKRFLCHFTSTEIPGSDDLDRVERSLVAQLRRHVPLGLGEGQVPLPTEHIDFERARRVLSVVPEPAVFEEDMDRELPKPLLVIWDGPDGPIFDQLTRMPYVFDVVTTFEPTAGPGANRRWMRLELEPDRRLCEIYLELHAEEIRRLTTTESHLPPEQLLLDRARGVIGRLVAMREWLNRQFFPPISVEQIPPPLYDAGVESLRVLGLDLEAVARVLSLLTAAREAIPYLAFRGLSPPLDRKRFHEIVVRLAMTGWVRVPGKRLEEWVDERDNVVWSTNPPNIGPLFEMTDESVATFLEGYLGKELELAHRALADALPQRHDNTGQSGWELAYGRKHAWWHLLQAGEVERLEELLTDVEYLAWVVAELGVEALVERLATAAEATNREMLRYLSEAVARLRPKLEQHPTDLRSLLVNQPVLADSGLSSRLRFSDGPRLRLRHRLMPDSAGALESSPETIQCAGDLGGSGRVLITGTGRKVWLWDIQTATPVAVLSHASPVFLCAVSRGEEPIYVTAEFGTLRSWNDQGGATGEAQLSGPVLAAALDPVGARAVVATAPGEETFVRTWRLGLDVRVGEPRWTLPYRVHMLRAGGADLVAVAGDGGASLWNQRTGDPLRWLERGTQVLCCDLHPRLDYLLTGSRDGMLKLWDIASGRLLTTLRGHDGPVRACQMAEVWSPTPQRPRLAVSAGDDGTVRLWGLEDGRLLGTVYGESPFYDLTASRDLSVIVAVDAHAVGWVLDRTASVGEVQIKRPQARRWVTEAISPVVEKELEGEKRPELEIGLRGEFGRVFLGYQRNQERRLRSLANALRDVGVEVWKDAHSQREVSDSRQLLEDPLTVGTVLWLTPKSAGPEIVPNLELSRALERAQRDGCFVLAVAAGGLSRRSAAKLIQTHALAGLDEWDIEQISQPLDEAQAVRLARKALTARLAQVDQFLPVNKPLKLGLYTKEFDGGASGKHLLLDWWHHFRRGPLARPGAWDSHLLPALKTLVQHLGEMKPRRSVEANGQLALAAAVALGAAFLEPKGIELAWQDSFGRHVWWSLREKPKESGFEARLEDDDLSSDEVAVCLSVVEDIRPSLVASQGDLPLFRQRIFLEKQGNYPHGLTPGQAVHLARLTVRALRESRPFRRAHLFLAGPAGLAVLVGQLLNTIPEVQTYELVEGQYRPAALLRP